MAWSAWAVHLLTASGALLGLLTITATDAGDYRLAFLWMAVATGIDSARRRAGARGAGQGAAPHLQRRTARRHRRLPHVRLRARVSRLPRAARAGRHRLVVVAAMLLSSAYGFSQEAAKTSDHFFTGLPVLLEHRRLLPRGGRGAAARQRGRADRAGRPGVRARSPTCTPRARRRCARPRSRWALHGRCWCW